MAEDRAQTGIVDLMRQTQALLYPNGTVAPGLEQVETLQKEMASHTETFVRHWFERRQEAAETGLMALRQISEANGTDPAAAMRAISDWQRGSFDRMTADLREWTTLCVHAATAAAIARPETPAQEPADQSADKGKRPAPKAQSAASKAKSHHATPV